MLINKQLWGTLDCFGSCKNHMDICEFTNIMSPDTNKEIGPTIEALYLSHHSPAISE